MLGALMRGISTREYDEVLPEIADTVGVSRAPSAGKPSKPAPNSSGRCGSGGGTTRNSGALHRRPRFGAHHIFSAVGVDIEGHKHILEIEAGATENAASVKGLLIGLRDRGLPTERTYLFVIDGAKALRAGIEEVFGTSNPCKGVGIIIWATS